MSSIPKHFGRSVLSPDLFIGRDKDLTEVHRKLFQDDHNALLLVNGQGGVGKTTLASHYYHQYEGEFQHLAWVLVENSLIDAVLTLASRLGLSFDPKMLPEERFQHLVEHMRNLEGPNLLIIDNANGMEDLKENILGLRSLTNFKLLITTRIETLGSSRMHRVGHLDKTSAFSLFYTLYKELDASSGNTLEQIFAAVDYNTLVIELLAKN
ncbi:MAG: NB-ARC domain-containing protein, partial [Bacteroidota bacterium]